MSVSTEFLERLKDDYNRDGFQIAYDFFVVFSRFEFALKVSRTYLKNGNGNKAEADWDKFARQIKPNFDKNKCPQLQDAVKYILDSPPKVQKCINGSAAWVDRNFNNQSEIEKICLSIRGVRNNLFHGGKFSGNYEPEARNIKLMQSSIIILDEWLLLNQEVGRLFESPLV